MKSTIQRVDSIIDSSYLQLCESVSDELRTFATQNMWSDALNREIWLTQAAIRNPYAMSNKVND